MGISCSSLLACPTCGPDCNYECQDGECVEVPRDNADSKSEPRRGGHMVFRNRTNNSSQTWSNFSADSSGGKIVNGLLLGFIIGVGMYGVSMLTDKIMPSK
jgi:hypothetical protein